MSKALLSAAAYLAQLSGNDLSNEDCFHKSLLGTLSEPLGQALPAELLSALPEPLCEALRELTCEKRQPASTTAVSHHPTYATPHLRAQICQ